MKTKFILLLTSIIISATLFSQTPQSKEIYFEGTAEPGLMHDGVFYISVIVTKGVLAGKKIRLYYSVGFDDENKIECKGNAKFDGTGLPSTGGKNIYGKILDSTGNFENYETGKMYIKKCYRPIELNWM